MKTIKIDKAEIRESIRMGDNCDGGPVLVVSDSGEYRIGWRRNQGEDHFHPSDLILPIPSLWIVDDWEAQIENKLDFLLDNWLAAINEEPNDLYPNEDLYASGFDDYGSPLHKKRKFQFQWKVGAPKGNKNAQKDERKEYIKIFAQRWDVPIGKAILQYLKEEGLSKKEWLDKYLLPQVFRKYPNLRP